MTKEEKIGQIAEQNIRDSVDEIQLAKGFVLAMAENAHNRCVYELDRTAQERNKAEFAVDELEVENTRLMAKRDAVIEDYETVTQERDALLLDEKSACERGNRLAAENQSLRELLKEARECFKAKYHPCAERIDAALNSGEAGK